MADNSKTYKLVIQGDTTDVTKQLETLRKTAVDLGLSLDRSVSTSNEKLGTTTTRATLLGNTLKDVRKVAEQFNAAFDKAGLNKYFTDLESKVVTVDKLLKSISVDMNNSVNNAANILATRAKNFADAAKQAEKIFNQNLAVTGTSGAAKQQTAEAELQIRRRLLQEVALLEKQLADGTLTNITATNAKRQGLYNQALTDIKALRAAAEQQIADEKARQVRLRQYAAEEKALNKQIVDEERKNYADRKSFYYNWINEVYRLQQEELAATKRKNAQIRSDTIAMYREMFDQIAAAEKAAQAKANSYRNSALIRGMSNQPSLSSLLLTAGMSEAGRQAAAQNQTLPPAINPNDTRNLREHNQALSESAGLHRNLLLHIGEIIIGYRLLNSAINTVQQAILAVPKKGIELEASVSILTATFQSGEAATRQLKYLEEEAARTGIAIGALRETFRTFSASALLAGESADTVKRIFSNMNTVSTALHMSGDTVTHTFLALAQMFNKGKIQSEELVRQLGNLIPGAFASFAKATGRTTQELAQQMKMGLVSAHETIDQFAAFLANRFSTAFDSASQGMNASLGRFQTATTLLYESVYTKTSETLITTLNSITDTVNKLKILTEDVYGFNKALYTVAYGAGFVTLIALFAKLGPAITATTVAMLGNPLTAFGIGLAYVAVKLAGAQTAQQKFNEELAKIPAKNAEDKVNSLAAAVKTYEERLQKVSTPSVDNLADFWVQWKNGQVKSYADYKVWLSQRLQDTKNQLATAKQDLASQVKTEPAEDQSMFGLLGLSSTDVANRVNKEEALMKQKIAEIKNNAKLAIKELEAQKEQLTFNQNNPGVSKQVLDQVTYQNKILNITRQIADVKLAANQAEEQAIRNKQRELQLLEEEFKKTPTAKDFYTAIRMRETGVTTALDTIHGSTDKFGNRGAAQISSKDARGAMQVKAAAFQEVMGTEVKFTEATLQQLDTAGQRYFDKQLKRYKDFRSALAAYNWGPGNVDKVYASIGAKIGLATQEELEKIKSLVPQDVQNYVNGVVSNLNRDKASRLTELRDIKYETELQTVISEKEQEQVAKEQQLVQLRQQGIVDLQKYKDLLSDINITYLQSVGKTKEAAEISFDKQNRDRFAIIDAGVKAGDKAAIQAQSQLALERQRAIALGEIEGYTKRTQQAATFYQGTLDRINTLINTGTITQLNGMRQIQLVKEDYLKTLEDEIKIREKELSMDKDNINAQEQLLQLKKEQALLKSEGAGAAYQFARSQLPGFVTDFQNNQAILNRGEKIDQQANTETAIPYKNAVTSYGNMLDNRAKLDMQYTLATKANYANMYAGIFELGSNTFLGLTSAAIKMYGAQSKEARAAFAAYKAMKIAEIIMATASSVMTQLSAGPYIGFVLAGLAAAMGAVQLATVVAQPMPAAHGGLDYVPKEQTYLLDKGERVLSPNQNRDLHNFMNSQSKQSAAVQPVNMNYKIVNVLDPSIVGDYLNTTDGEKLVMNIVSRNGGR